MVVYSAALSQRVAPRLSINLLKLTSKRPSSSTGAAGNRLSGRSRFYKEVGIKSLVTTPWEDLRKTPSSMAKNNNEIDNIASPISAGVDGTQSATGVHHISQSKKKSVCLEEILTPRFPGEESSATNEKNNGNTNNTSWYGITLDGRKVSTPMGQTLAVPSESLAYMIAAEWDSQTKEIYPSNMPLMTLACTALDQAAIHPQFYRDAALQYLRTDTTCFWADPTEDRILHRRQQKAWKGLHDFCAKRLDGSSPTTAYGIEGIIMSRKRGNKKYAGLPHPDKLLQAANRWTHSLDVWQLVALNSIATQAKSFLIAFAMLESAVVSISDNDYTTTSGSLLTPFTDVAQASEASRVEEELQISVWGLVEGQHDYDRLNSSVQLHSASLFAKTILFELN